MNLFLPNNCNDFVFMQLCSADVSETRKMNEWFSLKFNGKWGGGEGSKTQYTKQIRYKHPEKHFYLNNGFHFKW